MSLHVWAWCLLILTAVSCLLCCDRMRERMTVYLNGEAHEVPEGLTLTSLLEWLKLPADRVAVERNLSIVPRDRWPETRMEAGDRLEVVHFVGGGGN